MDTGSTSQKLMRSFVAFLLIGAAATAGFSAAARAQDGNVEYAVKGAFLYKFGAFVSWPEDAFETASSPLKVCVAGPDPFGDMLDDAVRDQEINGRSIEIVRLDDVQPDVPCHILYVGGMDPEQAEQALNTVQGAAVLTATDYADSGSGGIVHFVVRDNRVRFEIDNDAAARNGLTISSRLLALALNVEPRT